MLFSRNFSALSWNSSEQASFDFNRTKTSLEKVTVILVVISSVEINQMTLMLMSPAFKKENIGNEIGCYTADTLTVQNYG